MPREQRKHTEPGGAGGGGKAFNEKIDEIVTKVVPSPWVGTAFAGAAALTLVFFILTIVGFATGGSTPEEAQKDIDGLKEQMKTQATEHKKAIGDLRDGLKADLAEERDRSKKAIDTAKAERDKAVDELKAANAEKRKFQSDAGKTQKAEANVATLKKEKADLTAKLNQEVAARRKLESDLKGAKRDAGAVEKVTADMADLKKKYDELRASKDEQSKRDARAKDVFESIMASVAKTEDSAKQLAALNEADKRSRAELAGTVYVDHLDREIAKAERKVAGEQKLAAAKAKRDASSTYKEATKEAKAEKDPARQIEILTAARQALEGTSYADRLDEEIKKTQATGKATAAANAYKEVTTNVKKAPNAHEENLRALEDALAQVEGTKYAALLKKEIEKRQKTLKDDVAKGAYAELSALVKKNKDAHEENIAAAQAALVKAGGSKYEAQVKKILDSEKGKRAEVMGKAAYAKALEQVKTSKDRAANVSALEQLKAQAEGSKWAAKIESFLKTERKKLARENPEG